MTNAADVAAVLERAKRSGAGFVACCPAHDDSEPSLSIADGDKGPLVHCHAGCAQDAVLDALAGLGVELRRAKANGNGSNGNGRTEQNASLTVAQLAHGKALSAKQLAAWHVEDDRDGVIFNYLGTDGNCFGRKVRKYFAGEREFRWIKGGKVGLYGLWRLEDMRALDGRLVICEGETDALTMWAHDFCALGLPGASMWQDAWLADLPPDGPLYFVIEPDKGGQAVLAAIAKSPALTERARLIRMGPEHKDPSALHISDPEFFKDRFEALIQAAVPFKEPRKSRFRSAADIVANPIPAHWLLRPYLEQMVLALLYGELGSMKSFVTLDMLLAIASGRPWGGGQFTVKKQPVAYISAEGRGLDRRLRAWSLHHGIELKDVEFYALERPLDLSSAEKVADLADDIAALGISPSIVGIDTLSKNKGPLDENDTSEMATFLSQLDMHLRQRFKCSVLLVHHVGHMAKGRARGSYALMGDTEANYLVERTDPKELTIKLTTGRLKDSESPSPLFLKARIVDLGTVDEDGQAETSLVLLPTDEQPIEQKRRPSGKQQTALLKLLDERYKAGDHGWTTTDIRRMAMTDLGMGKPTAVSAQIGLVHAGFLKSTLGGLTLSDPPER